MTLSTRSEVLTIDPSLVPLWVSEVTISQYFQVATATVLVYYTITTLDKEGARWNAVTIVYFANRFIGILGAIAYLFWGIYGVNLPLCNFSLWTLNIANYVAIISIDYILIIRVLALYSQSKCLACVLKTLLGLEAIIKLVIFIYGTATSDINVARLGPEGPTVCGEGSDSSLLITLGILDWVIPMVYGIILMALGIYKAAEFWRISSGFKGFNLVKVLIVDQAMYFILVVLCCVFNLMQYKLEISNPLASALLDCLGNQSTLCILGSNMLFNLKEAAERGTNQGTSYRLNSRSVSAMEFA